MFHFNVLNNVNFFSVEASRLGSYKAKKINNLTFYKKYI